MTGRLARVGDAPEVDCRRTSSVPHKGSLHLALHRQSLQGRRSLDSFTFFCSGTGGSNATITTIQRDDRSCLSGGLVAYPAAYVLLSHMRACRRTVTWFSGSRRQWHPRDPIWCSTCSIPGSAEEFSTYAVLAGRIPRALTPWPSGRGRERRGTARTSGRLVAHSPALGKGYRSADSCCVMSWSTRSIGSVNCECRRPPGHSRRETGSSERKRNTEQRGSNADTGRAGGRRSRRG
jgi:hypothetical protein